MAINNAPHIHQLVMCANMFIRKDVTYLMLRRSPLKRWAAGVLHPVGGKIDPNEDPLTAAKREAFEETGLSVKNIQLRAVIFEIDPVKAEPGNWMIFYFCGDYDSGSVTSTEEGELVWLTAAEIKQDKLFPSVRALIDHMLDHEAGPVFARFDNIDDAHIDERTQIIEPLVK